MSNINLLEFLLVYFSAFVYTIRHYVEKTAYESDIRIFSIYNDEFNAALAVNDQVKYKQIVGSFHLYIERNRKCKK